MSSTPSLQLTISPGTVYTTSVPGQSSLATLTFTITNTGDDTQVSSVGILLPENLYVAGSLGSITPVADAEWNFTASTTQGAFQASPASPVTIPANGTATFTLQNITIAQQSTTPAQAGIDMKVKLQDGTPIEQTLTVSILQATSQISYFTAEPTIISPGQSSTLQWGCTAMDYCIVSPPVNTNQLPVTGSTQVSPQENTTYTLDAYATDLHLQQQVSVSVQRPQVVSFVPVQGNAINYDTNISLEWQTIDSDSVTLSVNPQGPNIPANLPVNTNGTPVVVGPLTQATTITLTPSNTAGTDGSPSSQTIDIYPATATFSASPTTNVWEQDPVTISWQITNAASVTVNPPLPGGPSLQNLNDSLVIYPEADVDYTLTVDGAPNTLPVVENISFDVTTIFSAMPNPITLNDPDEVTFSWVFVVPPNTTVVCQLLTGSTAIKSMTYDNETSIGIEMEGSYGVSSPPDGAAYNLTVGPQSNPTQKNMQIIISNQHTQN